MNTLENHLDDRRNRIEELLQKHLPPINSKAKNLHEAMRYAVLGGGKRLRPLLVYLTGEALGASWQTLDLPACAVEMIHAYSLIHDDLPAMDNDDFRRGKPSCHKVYGEAVAILAGDALQTLAFELLSQPSSALSSTQMLAMIQTLAKASGFAGMVGGQTLDLQAQENNLKNSADIESIRHLKTGALIRASVALGIIAAEESHAQRIQALHKYGTCLGIAFQILDDIHDIPQDSFAFESENNVGTQTSQYSNTQNAQIELLSWHQQAKVALSALDERGAYLAAFTDHILEITLTDNLTQ